LPHDKDESTLQHYVDSCFSPPEGILLIATDGGKIELPDLPLVSVPRRGFSSLPPLFITSEVAKLAG
jgi:hypothetical protein